MPIARFQLPDGRIARFEIPAGLNPEQAEQLIQAELPNIAAPKPAPFSVRDLALSVGQGAVGGVKALTDVFGAGNVASEALERGQRALGEAMTPERQAELAAQQQRAKAAEQQGMGAEVSAALQSIKEAPLQATGQAVGSFLPFVATSVVGAAAKLLPATMRAINVAVGAAQGAGAVKGSIYDSVKDQLKSEGMPEELAEKQAQAAQAYVGKNIEQIGLGGVLGGVAGRFGAEQLFSKAGAQAAPAGFARRAGQAAVGEALPEAAQAGQEQAAANIALQREGFNVPTLRGVAGAATTEGIMGGLGGAAVATVRGPEVQPPPAPPAPPQPPAPPAAPQIDLTKPYAELTQQREQLRAMPKTPETTAAIEQLSQRIIQLDTEEVQRLRAQRAQEQADAQKAAQSAFAAQQPQQMEMREMMPQGAMPQQLDLFGKPVQQPAAAPAEPTLTPRQQTIQDKREAREAGQQRIPFRYTAEGEPTSTTPPPPPRIYMPDIEAVGVPFKTARDWFNRNVVNRTKEEVAALVQQDPSLVKGQGSRAKILRSLLGPDIPAFKEPARGKPTPVSAQPQPGPDLRGVGVPSAPPIAGGAAPAAAPAPQGIDATGLARPAPAAPAGVGGEGQQPPALTPQQIEAKAVADAKKAAAARRKKVAPGETAPIVPPVAPPAAAAPAARRARPVVPPVAPPAAPVAEAPAPVAPAAPVADTRTASEVEAEIESLRNRQRGLLLPSGKVPMPKSKARKAYDELETQVKDLLPVYDAKASEERVKAAEDMKRRMAEQQKKTAAPERKAPAAPAPAAAPSKPIPESMYEPTGTSAFGMEEGEVEILRGPQAELFLPTREETRKRAEAADERRRREEAAAEETEPPKAETPEGQMELDFNALVTEPGLPEPAAWAKDVAVNFQGGKAVYADDEIALIRTVNKFGYTNYIAARRNEGSERVDVRSATSKLITKEERERLIEIRKKAIEIDEAQAQEYPQGPFTGATNNVVGSKNVPSKYVDYLTGLMKSVGLGDVRVLLHTGQDLREDSDAYHIHGAYLVGLTTTEVDETVNGSVISFGPNRNDFIIYLKEGMSEAKAVETIAHELGHAIQQIAYDNAPTDVQFAITKEYEAWFKATRKGDLNAIEFVHSLRNRATAQEMDAAMRAEGLSDMKASDLPKYDDYWTTFAEWFADNVSRWATTSEKPVSVVEKFFASLAQKMRDLLKVITGRTYLPAKSVKDFLDSMGPGSAQMWFEDKTRLEKRPEKQLSVSVSTEKLIDSMGPINNEQRSGLKALIDGVKGQVGDPDKTTRFRVMMADSAAAIEQKLLKGFNGAVRDSLGNLNPMGLFRQAQDYTKLLLEYFQQGALTKNTTTGLWEVSTKPGVDAPAEVFAAVDAWAAKNGYTRERGQQIASRILEGVRLDQMRTANRTQGTEFVLHLKDPEIDQLVREYNADPDLKAISDLMDKPRIDMVDNMVKVGRLSPEQGKAWKEVVGYVPFDRLDDFTTSFAKVKKVSGKGIAQVGKLPELVGSINRPVGNVFENYLNTLGWMVRQVTNTDATRTTLKALEGLGFAKPLGNTPQGKENTVGTYVDGEMKYWELPSRYDVLAFKDLTVPKTGLVRFLGEFSNILRKTVTSLPPFALKQVADDVQRAIFTSGVKNPGPMIRMALANFGSIAVAELRGIKHPAVRDFGALGLTGEYDFQQGRPADSLLKDLGYKKRGRFENLLHKLDAITRASDLAVRKAIYDQTMRETNDAVLAQTRAREFINFRRRGASNFSAVMTTTIPFFNAYAQGMDVLYRAATGEAAASSLERNEARKLFWSRAAMLAAFSTLYALGKSEDEDYREMDLRTRDGNWILGDGLKLAVPSELGAIFKVIPERVVEYYKRQGTPEEQEAFEAVRTAMAYIAEQYVGRMVPIPQAAKPLLEAFTNFSFLTGRPLEGIFQKGQQPSERRTATTSELAIQIAAFARDTVGVEVSPIMIDNTLRGYFGSTAAMVTMATDSLLNPTRVDRPLHKYALLSNYLYDPVGTRRLSEFYEEREKVGQLNATLNELAKTDPDRAEAFAMKHEDRLQLERGINATLQQLENTRAYRKYLNSPLGASEMDKAERESELEELRRIEADIVGWLREAKTEIRKFPINA